jgi:hypothetical protein
MANGFQGSQEEWNRLEAPLIAVDPKLEAFARTHGLALGKNHKYPERSLTWGGAVSRLIQIFIAEDEGPTFNLWLCASQDRGADRFWKQEFLLKSVTGDELAAGLDSRLAQAHQTATSWEPSDLVATHLRS